MPSPTPHIHPSVEAHRRAGLTMAAWALAAVILLVQGMAEQAMDRGAVTLEFLLRWRLYPVALWAALTPLIMGAARRWPVRGGGWPGHLALHAGLFGTWMVLSNALLRLPDLAAHGPGGLGREAVAAAIEYAPAGALLWAGLVAAGRGRSQSGRAPEGGVAHGGNGAGRPEGAAGPAAGEAEILILRDGERTCLVPRDSVRWVEADGDYLRVHTAEGKFHVRGPMRGMERRLGNGRFLRIHRSTLVNAAFIRELQPRLHGDYAAILRDGTELRIPRSRREIIRRLREWPETR